LDLVDKIEFYKYNSELIIRIRAYSSGVIKDQPIRLKLFLISELEDTIKFRETLLNQLLVLFVGLLISIVPILTNHGL
jgi:hypothetical protein